MEARKAHGGVNWGCIAVALGTAALWALIALAAWLIAVEAPAQAVCCGPNGQLWVCTPGDAACRGPLGLACAGEGLVIEPAGACVAATPTPTPTPTATPTPTPTPSPAVPITLRQLPYLPWALSYQYQVPWVQRHPDGSWTITGNAGHSPGESLTPPPLGTATTAPGECKIVVLFPAAGAPQARQTYCSSQTVDVWETGDYILPVSLLSPAEAWGWGVFTARPVGPIGGDTDRDVQLERITLPAIPGNPTVLSPFPSRTTILAAKGVNYAPLGIVDLAGQQMMYVTALHKQGSWPFLLHRLRITQYGGLEFDPSFPPVPMSQVGDGGFGPLNLVLAHDGTRLLITDSVWPQTMACHLWQSADWGQTWSRTDLVIPAPAGSVGIAQCGIAVAPGGIAVEPMWGVCQTFWSQDGDDGLDWSKPGDWRPYVWYQQGASLPGNVFTAASAYPPPTPTRIINPVPNPKPVAAKALAVTPHVEPHWLPGTILRPTPPRTP